MAPHRPHFFRPKKWISFVSVLRANWEVQVNKFITIPRVWTTGALLLCCRTVPAETFSLISNEADVTWESEVPMTNQSYLASGGDFDGDGFEDLAVLRQDPEGHNSIFLFSGKSSLQGGRMEERVLSRLGDFGQSEPRFLFADVDGDKKSDLILFPKENVPAGEQNVRVLYGRSPCAPQLNLSSESMWGLQGTPNTSFGSAVAVGDVNGDGWVDLVVGAHQARSYAGEVYLLLGDGKRRTGSWDLTTSTGVVTFIGTAGSTLGRKILIGEINNDQKRDLVLPAPQASPAGRHYAGIIHIVKGALTFPATWDFSTTPSDIAVWGSGSFLSADLLADVDGDGRDDLFVDTLVIPGSAVDSGNTVIDLLPGAPSHPLTLPLPFSSHNSIAGDFDGDGRKDVFPPPTGNNAGIYLSNNVAEFPASFPSSPSMTIKNVFGGLAGPAIGDLNGDGFQDAVFVESEGSLPDEPKGMIRVFYGFRPLENPVIQAHPSVLTSATVPLTLSVEGDPTEVQFGGDVELSVKDRWVPFKPTMNINLAPGEGTRSIIVVFRNRFGRISRAASVTVTTVAETPGPQPVTTVLRQGGAPLRVEYRFTSPGHLNVIVRDRLGHRVRTVADQDCSTGIWPVEWDGQNESGQYVAPGVYLFYAETPAGLEKTRVVIQ